MVHHMLYTKNQDKRKTSSWFFFFILKESASFKKKNAPRGAQGPGDLGYAPTETKCRLRTAAQIATVTERRRWSWKYEA